MRFSTKAEYGLRAIVHLAQSEQPKSLSSIAKQEKISLSYLERIFSLLKKHELVTSYKGVRGGYVLSRAPEKISIGDVIRVLEGNLYQIKCHGCSVVNCCVNTVWMKLGKQIESTLDSINLKSLIK